MTLNSKGLEKAKEAIARSYVTYPDGSARTHISDWFDLDAQDAVDFGVMTEPKWHGHSDVRSNQQNAYIATVLGSGPLQVAITAYLSALPPVDGLEVVMEKICHKEQIGIWANEITSALALSDFLREEWTFDDSVDLEREIAAQILDIVKAAFTHPGLDLIASLSQASSVIAGLKAEISDLRDEWQAEYDARIEANTARRLTDKRVSFLEEQNKRLREALNQSRLAFSGYVSPRSAIDMIDALGDHNG